MGPQYPLHPRCPAPPVGIEGEIIRRTRAYHGYLHTGMEKTAEGLASSQAPRM